MSPMIIFGILAALLFGGAYLTKRRFGVLGLALAGGAMLSNLWGSAGGMLFAAEGIRLGILSPENLAIIVMTLLPAFLVMFRGPGYRSSLMRLGGSALFTIFAVILVLHPVQSLLVSSPLGASLFRSLMLNRDLIVTLGLILALVDLFMIKPSTRSKSDSKH